MQDKTIDSVLWELRAQIVRDGLDGLHHVNALLLARGCDPEDQHIPRKKPANQFRQSELKRLVMTALRDGPQTGKALAACIAAQRPEVGPEDAYKRVYLALARMKAAGFVEREGRLWTSVAFAAV